MVGQPVAWDDAVRVCARNPNGIKVDPIESAKGTGNPESSRPTHIRVASFDDPAGERTAEIRPCVGHGPFGSVTGGVSAVVEHNCQFDGPPADRRVGRRPGNGPHARLDRARLVVSWDDDHESLDRCVRHPGCFMRRTSNWNSC